MPEAAITAAEKAPPAINLPGTDAEDAAAQIAVRVLQLVSELSIELHPHRRGQLNPTLDAHLDKDFGLDSLG
ncbi:MAG: hypothetical protein WAW96_17930, partial [Alphaproteobacteria bacterium]